MSTTTFVSLRLKAVESHEVRCVPMSFFFLELISLEFDNHDTVCKGKTKHDTVGLSHSSLDCVVCVCAFLFLLN